VSSSEPLVIDQALFGYADGHRQIGSSVRLPSKDQYQLAAASDLASGASLGPNDSYLTGLPLAESRRFALIRTWSAPEMPRPGCVWSHVILIEPRLLASHGDLADFLALLKRPHAAGNEEYAEPLKLLPNVRSMVAPDLSTIESLIWQYYSGERALLDPDVPAPNLEAAIMAVWSQQWPRLRSSFAFRTASGAERRRSELINYDVQVGGGRQNRPIVAKEDWVAAGTDDAVSAMVNPLRRFLWRYGRDLSSSRKNYRTLVELYLAVSRSKELLAEEAIQIFEAMPDAGDGEILKRDILGVGVSPSLLPALAPDELLRLLVSNRFDGLSAEDKLLQRFNSIPPSQVPALADFVERHGRELGNWSEAIDHGLVAVADRDALLGQLPGRIRRLILESRPELIDRETLAPLSDEALIELAAHHTDDDATAPFFASCIVRRDLGSANERLFLAMPLRTFVAAVDAMRAGELDRSWMRTISWNAREILLTEWPKGVRKTADLAAGLVLLRFPKEANRISEFWTELLANAEDDASGEDRVRLHAFLLRAALQEYPSPSTWKLVGLVLPELRPIILSGLLPNDVHSMLSADLPRFSSVAYWDIDRRILMSLSHLRLRFADERSLRELNLTPSEMDTVLFGAQVEAERSKARPWWWPI
jgi:hypothetical protein